MNINVNNLSFVFKGPVNGMIVFGSATTFPLYLDLNHLVFGSAYNDIYSVPRLESPCVWQCL